MRRLRHRECGWGWGFRWGRGGGVGYGWDWFLWGGGGVWGGGGGGGGGCGWDWFLWWEVTRVSGHRGMRIWGKKLRLEFRWEWGGEWLYRELGRVEERPGGRKLIWRRSRGGLGRLSANGYEY